LNSRSTEARKGHAHEQAHHGEEQPIVKSPVRSTPIVFGITVVSVGIHYLSKFVGAGHAVRGGLARAFSTGERIAILHARGDVDHGHWPPRLRGPRTSS